MASNLVAMASRLLYLGMSSHDDHVLFSLFGRWTTLPRSLCGQVKDGSSTGQFPILSGQAGASTGACVALAKASVVWDKEFLRRTPLVQRLCKNRAMFLGSHALALLVVGPSDGTNAS